jgi:hypothetical protein
MLTKCQVARNTPRNFDSICINTFITTARHHMQEEDIEQRDDAATHASKSHDKKMNDKREDARRMAEQLIAEETRDAPNSAMRTYLVAVVIGLIVWGVIYFIWQRF